MKSKRITNEQKKEWAKTLFVKERLPQKEIAEKVGVSPATMTKWVNENDSQWKKLQKNLFLTREEQMAHLLDELVQINESIKLKPVGLQFADSKLADVRRKLIKDIKELETSAAIPEVIHSCKKLLEFVRDTDLKEAQRIAGIVDAFIKSIL